MRQSPVRLADFIESHTEQILAEWIAFAATRGDAARTLDIAGLRDHAREMLTAIITDLRTTETDTERDEKSKGTSDPRREETEKPAGVHGADRAESGFTLGDMVSEYRALRASVIRLWTQTSASLGGGDFEDLLRFNEAIDEALAASITRFTEDLDRSREMFIAILGHDLRVPLGAVITSSQFMLDTGELTEPHLTLTSRIVQSARRMNLMVGDLLDFTRGQSGSGIPITRDHMDLGTIARHAVEETSAAHPQSVLKLTTSGDLRGSWDSARVSQVLANLLANAVQHGSAKMPISVAAQGEAGDVVLRVHNQGPAIVTADLGELFSPLKRDRLGAPASRDSTNLGLGLYIAERIVTAHGGTIEVASSGERGTTFTVRLPR